MKMGDFHEELMGKIPGYETYKVGHVTGCDVGSIDGKEIYEVKNKDNTTKGSDGKHIIQQLTKLLEKGIHPIYVQINCPAYLPCSVFFLPGRKIGRGTPRIIHQIPALIFHQLELYLMMVIRHNFYDIFRGNLYQCRMQIHIPLKKVIASLLDEIRQSHKINQ